MGHNGGYTAITDYIRGVRPARTRIFERRFDTPAGRQAQVNFTQFRVEVTVEPGVVQIVWLFTMVLGHADTLKGKRPA